MIFSGNVEFIYAFEILFSEKLLHDFGKGVLGYPLHEDFLLECAMESIDCVCDYISRDYLEEDDLYVYIFSDSYMDDYYRLCNEYGKRYRQSFSNNKYVKKARCYVDKWIGNINSWSYEFEHLDSEKEQQKLIVRIDCEFTAYVDLLEALLHVFEFYKKGVGELKKELGIDECGDENQCKKILMK